MEENMIDDTKVALSDYLRLNEEFIQKEKLLEDKIKVDIENNPDKYPVNAMDLYFFDYREDLSEDEEEGLVLLENIITDRFKEEYEELDILRDNIVKYAGHVVISEKDEVKSGEN